MECRDIYYTEFDLNRLTELLGVWQTFNGNKTTSIHLESLIEELDRAHIVLPKDIPADVVTMNSRVRLSDPSKEEDLIYTLVFPRDADSGAGKISVLAPIGTAILGYRVGDIIRMAGSVGNTKGEN